MERQSSKFEEEPRSYREILEKFAKCFGMELRFYTKAVLTLDGEGTQSDGSLTYVYLVKTRECGKKTSGDDKLHMLRSSFHDVLMLSFHSDTGFWQCTTRGKDCEEVSRIYVEDFILNELLEAIVIDSGVRAVEVISKSFPRSSLEELMVFLDLNYPTG